MIKILDYNDVYSGMLTYSQFGFVKDSCSRLGIQKVRSKRAFFYTDNETYYPATELRYNMKKFLYDDEKVLFVGSNCKLPRDLYRNSGLKITRDKEKADVYVIPEIKDNYFALNYDILAYNTASKYLYLYSMQTSYYSNNDIQVDEETLFKLAKKLLEDKGLTIYQDRIYKNAVIQFLPKYDEFVDLVDSVNNVDDMRYMEEVYVPVDSPNTISLETLQTWKYYTDGNMLAKALLASNWHEYPATICCFLERHPKVRPVRGYYGSAFDSLLTSIGFDSYTNPQALLSNRTITPQDWNMLQDFLLSELGLPPEGGWVDNVAWHNGSMTGYGNFIKKRVAVAPLKISQDMKFEDLINIADNT